MLVTQFSVTFDTVSDSWHCTLASFTLVWYNVCVCITGNLWQLLGLNILEVFPTKHAKFTSSIKVLKTPCSNGTRTHEKNRKKILTNLLRRVRVRDNCLLSAYWARIEDDDIA